LGAGLEMSWRRQMRFELALSVEEFMVIVSSFQL